MTKTELLVKIERFRNAVERLKEAIDRAEDDLDKDGVIQRFEVSVELFWKILKSILAYEGIECYSPKSCVKEAFRAGIVKDDEIGLDMIADRNLSSHIYDEKASEEIFERIKKVYIHYLSEFFENLKI